MLGWFQLLIQDIVIFQGKTNDVRKIYQNFSLFKQGKQYDGRREITITRDATNVSEEQPEPEQSEEEETYNAEQGRPTHSTASTPPTEAHTGPEWARYWKWKQRRIQTN